MTTSADRFHEVVHHAVVELTTARSTTAEPTTVPLGQLLGVCSRLTHRNLETDKWRWRGHEAARQAATYLAFLQPPSGWLRLPPDMLDEPFELVWNRRDDDAVLADVLMTRSRGSQVWTPHTSGLPRRLVRAGHDRFGSAFVGVRVVVLSAPGASLLVTDPTGPPAPLPESPWWFHAPPMAGVDLVAAASEVTS